MVVHGTGMATITDINRLMLTVEGIKMNNRVSVSKGNQAGFTIIELVMVIVILGILAAFALPRFADLGGSARAAAVQGVAGSMRSAAGMAHSLQLATGVAAGGTVTMEGNVINLSNGYPTTVDIATATGFTPTGYTAATVGTTITWTRDDAATPANCSIAYTEATAAGLPANVVTDVTAC
jgi:MSHA pilin protein MshA